MTLKTNRFTLTLVAASLALSLSACGAKEEKKAATQVAAKVGSEEISVHQINQILSRTNSAGATPEAVKSMSHDVLEKLIDQQLAVDQATEAKLHRSPDVVSQLEAARRDILSRAYLQKITSALPKPAPEELKKYYAENPALFADRRIYNVQEIVVPASTGMAIPLREMASASKPIEDVAAFLKSKDIKFQGGSASRTAEQIPLELLKQVNELKDGQSTVFANARTITVLRVASSQRAPVSEAEALPRIEQFLTNQRATEAVLANLKTLRAGTKITYMGDFDTSAAAAVAAAPAGGTTAPAATATVAPTTAPASAPGTEKSALEKGVAGLK
jgi:EpsD family peptidyl-prolyl cis-trans isomerase